MFTRVGLLPLAWFLIGLIVASNHGYLGGIHDLGDLASAVLAIVLWPLVMLDISLAL